MGFLRCCSILRQNLAARRPSGVIKANRLQPQKSPSIRSTAHIHHRSDHSHQVGAVLISAVLWIRVLTLVEKFKPVVDVAVAARAGIKLFRRISWPGLIADKAIRNWWICSSGWAEASDFGERLLDIFVTVGRYCRKLTDALLKLPSEVQARRGDKFM